MCGRTSLYAKLDVFEDRFDATADFEYEPRYNITPRQDLAVIRNTTTETISQQNWGLLAPWADDPNDGPRPINARAETIAEKPIFKDAFAERRCLVLADGYQVVFLSGAVLSISTFRGVPSRGESGYPRCRGATP